MYLQLCWRKSYVSSQSCICSESGFCNKLLYVSISEHLFLLVWTIYCCLPGQFLTISCRFGWCQIFFYVSQGTIYPTPTPCRSAIRFTALLWTFSNISISAAVQGDQAGIANSRWHLINYVYSLRKLCVQFKKTVCTV